MPEQPRWYLKPETKAEFNKFKRELEQELDLASDLSQNEFVALLCKYRTQILDVIVNIERGFLMAVGKVAVQMAKASQEKIDLEKLEKIGNDLQTRRKT